MKILVLNSGSSSLKYQLIDMENEQVLAKGNYERIGMEGSFVTHKVGGEKYKYERDARNHEEAISFVLSQFTDNEHGVISSLDEISAVGHRVVHGGEKFNKSVVITDEVIDTIRECIPLAPLHNPAALTGIEACMKVMPGKKNVAVFDTAFHQTIPEERYIYPIPYKYYEKYGVRKYGFHGTSHRYVSARVAELVGKPVTQLKTIVCHLGQGASLCAVLNGKSVDTSMGLTPLEGLVMGTRSGDLDPAVLEFVMRKENLSIEEMMTVLNKKSGFLGISEITGDVRDLKNLAKEGNERAKLAIDMFAYRVKKYIGAYMAALGHVDAIIFEGGIGEHNFDVVNKCVEGLEPLGIVFDSSHNDEEVYEGIISKPESKIKMYVIQTNEELEIARETMKAITK